MRDDPDFTREEIEAATRPEVHDWISDRLVELATTRLDNYVHGVDCIEYLSHGKLSFRASDLWKPIGELTVSIDDIMNSEAALLRWKAEKNARDAERDEEAKRNTERLERKQLAHLKEKYE